MPSRWATAWLSRIAGRRRSWISWPQRLSPARRSPRPTSSVASTAYGTWGAAWPRAKASASSPGLRPDTELALVAAVHEQAGVAEQAGHGGVVLGVVEAADAELLIDEDK